MSCVLSIIGKDFDIDSFLEKSKLIADQKRYIGEPFFPKTQPNGRKMEISRIGKSRLDHDDRFA